MMTAQSSVAANIGVVAGSTGVGLKWEMTDNLYLDVEGAAFTISLPKSTNCVSNCSMSARWALVGVVKKTSFIDFGVFYNDILAENYDYDRSMAQFLKSSGTYGHIAPYIGKSFDLTEKLGLDVGLIYLGRPKFSFQPSTTNYTQKQLQYEQSKAERIFGKYRYMPKLSLIYHF